MLTWVFVYAGATDQMPSIPRSSVALSEGSCPGRRLVPLWPSPTPLPRTMHVVSVPATAFVATTAIRRVAIWPIATVTPLLAHTLQVVGARRSSPLGVQQANTDRKRKMMGVRREEEMVFMSKNPFHIAGDPPQKPVRSSCSSVSLCVLGDCGNGFVAWSLQKKRISSTNPPTPK